MKQIHSLRWQMQLWHGLVLLLVLTGFGFTAWRLQYDERMRSVDRELEQRMGGLLQMMRPPGPGPQLPPADGLPPIPGPGNGGLGALETAMVRPFYYMHWLMDGRLGSATALSPGYAQPPSGTPGSVVLRTEGRARECIRFLPRGGCILVGREIQNELDAATRYALWLGGAGGIVLAFGLAGGGWVVSRTLRPVSLISATAKKIAAGDLSQRITDIETHSELGVLVQDLNHTFARLQAGFDRQVQFTADASHELRTPVAVVITQTQTALARDRSTAEYRESLLACQRAAQRMRSLIDSLLALARLDAGDTAARHAPCELSSLVNEAVEMLRPLASARNIQIDLDLRAVWCAVDSGQIAQVVANLVGNAITYNTPDGRISVTVAPAPAAAVLTVVDTGPGIDPADLPHIFDRFYRADKVRAGTAGHSGLGLAIVQSIIAAHGGTIGVTSHIGAGTTFTVRLPTGSKSGGVEITG